MARFGELGIVSGYAQAVRGVWIAVVPLSNRGHQQVSTRRWKHAGQKKGRNVSQDNLQLALSQLILSLEALQHTRWLSVSGRRAARHVAGELKALSDASAEVVAIMKGVKGDEP